MRKIYSLKRVVPLGAALLFCLTFIIYGCRKELKIVPLSAADSVSEAQKWYESVYPPAIANHNGVSINVNSVNGNQNTNYDYSAHVKPDWSRAETYQRFKKGVVEMPLDASTQLLGNVFNQNTGKTVYTKENSKTSFLLLKDSTGYKAYVMVLIGDDSYINGDGSKMAKNTYRHRDKNFTGMLIYFTAKGDYVSAYRYQNGKRLKPTTTTATSSTTASRTAQSLKNDVADLPGETDCTAWYWETYYPDGRLLSSTYMFTTCVTNGIPTDPSGNPPSTGGSPPPPPPPPPGCPATNAVKGNDLKINVAQPDPGTGDGDDDGGGPTEGADTGASGGFPPPGDSPTGCPVAEPVTDPTSDPIIRVFCSSVSQDDQGHIQDAINTFKTEDCVHAGIYSFFTNYRYSSNDSNFPNQIGVRISFCTTTQNANGIAGGTTEPVTASITFYTDQYGGSIASTMDEELFHIYQNLVYPGGINQYGSVNNPQSDIEFEASLLQDIISKTSQVMMGSPSTNDIASYSSWIKSITNNGTVFPKTIDGFAWTDPLTNVSYSGQDAYDHFMDIYYSINMGRLTAPLHLAPKGLLSSFNNNNCN